MRAAPRIRVCRAESASRVPQGLWTVVDACPLASGVWKGVATLRLFCFNRPMRALLLDGQPLQPRQLLVRNDYPDPAPASGESIVRVRMAGICGTDLELARGYMNYCGVPGHEFVGEVVETQAGELAGRRVVGEINAACGRCAWCLDGLGRHCPSRTVLGILGRDGAFAEYLRLPDENLIAIPDSASSSNRSRRSMKSSNKPNCCATIASRCSATGGSARSPRSCSAPRITRLCLPDAIAKNLTAWPCLDLKYSSRINSIPVSTWSSIAPGIARVLAGRSPSYVRAARLFSKARRRRRR